MNANIKVVERKCLNDIINWLSHEQFNQEYTKLLNEQGYYLAKDNDCQRLFVDMLSLNLQAVESINPEDYDDFNFERSAKPSLDQALEAMNVWLCACMKGEPLDHSLQDFLQLQTLMHIEMESSKLYVTFEKIGAKIRRDKIYHYHGWSKRKCNEAVYS